MVTFGIEEEYCFVDPATIEPRDVSPAVYRALRVERVESRNVQREFLLSQMERPTPVCESADQALADLQSFRLRLRDAAGSVGVLACTSGTYPRRGDGSRITDKPRYRRVGDEFGMLSSDYYFNGLHIHVHIDDREAGVTALNALRSWMPVFTALGANSPYWDGLDTGFASWRTIQLQRWATRGTPPAFADAADYDRRIAAVVGVGGTFDDALIAWNIRLSNHVPTIELRAPDGQLEAWQSVLLAVLARALVTTAVSGGSVIPPLPPELIDAAVWHSARDGLTANLMHPSTGQLAPARTVVDALVEHAAEALEAEGDLDRVREWIERLFAEGTGAARQRAAYEHGGLPALAALFHGAVADATL